MEVVTPPPGDYESKTAIASYMKISNMKISPRQKFIMERQPFHEKVLS